LARSATYSTSFSVTFIVSIRQSAIGIHSQQLFVIAVT
jgi:hypothetical protein